MAQRPTADFNIDPNVTSGTDLANILNRFQDAIDSGNSGASRPAYLDAGGLWVQTGNPMRLYLYDGTKDNELYNTTDGIITGIDDGTEAGQLTVWDGSQWAPNSSLKISNGKVGIGMDPTLLGDKFQVNGRVLFTNPESATRTLVLNQSAQDPLAYRQSFAIQSSGTDMLSMVTGPVSSINSATALSLATPTTSVILDNVNDKVTFSGTVVVEGNRPVSTKMDLIETLSTLRAATQDETVDVRQALASACDKLIEKFEAMQNEVETMPAPETMDD